MTYGFVCHLRCMKYLDRENRAGTSRPLRATWAFTTARWAQGAKKGQYCYHGTNSQLEPVKNSICRCSATLYRTKIWINGQTEFLHGIGYQKGYLFSAKCSSSKTTVSLRHLVICEHDSLQFMGDFS